MLRVRTGDSACQPYARQLWHPIMRGSRTRVTRIMGDDLMSHDMPNNARAIGEDYLSQRASDLKRMVARTVADDAATVLVRVRDLDTGEVRFITKRQKVGSALADHPSAVTPLSGLSATRGQWTSDEWNYDETDIWGALVEIREYGVNGAPLAAIAAKRAIVSADDAGRHWVSERLDDILSDATIRAYERLTEMLASSREAGSGVRPVPMADVDMSTNGPSVGDIAGFDVDRMVRCGTCTTCDGYGGSRYNTTTCEAPKSVTEYVTAQRVLMRAIYASARSAVTTILPVGVPTDTRTVPGPEDTITLCGHGASCRREACRVDRAVRTAIAACDAIGEATIGRNSRPTIIALDAISLALGKPASRWGHREAEREIRSSRVTRTRVTRTRVTRRVPPPVADLAPIPLTRCSA